jgi:hypothetical protein
MPIVEVILNAQMTKRGRYLFSKSDFVIVRHSSFGFRHWHATGEEEHEYQQEHEPAEIRLGF